MSFSYFAPSMAIESKRVGLITGFILLPSLQIGCVPRKAKIDNAKTLETLFRYVYSRN